MNDVETLARLAEEIAELRGAVDEWRRSSDRHLAQATESENLLNAERSKVRELEQEVTALATIKLDLETRLETERARVAELLEHLAHAKAGRSV